MAIPGPVVGVSRMRALHRPTNLSTELGQNLSGKPASAEFLDASLSETLSSTLTNESVIFADIPTKFPPKWLGCPEAPELNPRPAHQTRVERETMKPLFRRNIDTKGRLVRGIAALALLGGAGVGVTGSVWVGGGAGGGG